MSNPAPAPITVNVGSCQQHPLSVGPMCIKCPHCHADIQTTVSYKKGTLAWILCLVLFLVGCWCGCCLIPLYNEGCLDVEHSCPNCHACLGTYDRMRPRESYIVY
ncbi:Lipopolysaccharide-induced tumor necrosis factor-alpha factor-like protein [Aphelenchoides bicaudatus]|nr:Lipopolysaccharide-induced tumor necrosis factor-alpha factor-like protein [Aphelenchoides bicaudatus]